MATGARGQGAIQSNEIALGRGKKRKRMMREGGRDGGKERGREERAVGNITSYCVYLLRTMATV